MAHKKPSVLEINGRRFDADSGVDLDAPLVDIAPPTILEHHLAVLGRSPASHAKAHKPERSHTLMRRSVQKPAHSAKKLRSQSHTGFLATVPSITVAPKLSLQSVHPGRLQRSKVVGKSTLIQHYSAGDSVVATPVEHHRPTAMPKVAVATTPAHHAATHKSASQAVFERALAHADAHEAKPFNPKKHAREQRKHARHLKRVAKPLHRRTSSLVTVSFAVLAITGLVALQFRPSLTLHVANARAGFSASLPSFRPSGFGYGSFSYRPGSVGIQFKNDASDRTFSLQQQTSNWDNQTLLVNHVAASSHTYQALKIAGRTIYIYGQNNASWINNGVLYQLNSNGNLSTNDVLNIASSL